MKSTLFSLLILAAACVTVLGQTAPTAPFTVTIAAKQDSCTVGNPCLIHIVLKNTSAGQLIFPEIRGNRGELNYRVFVWLSGGSPAKDTEYGNKMKDRMFSGGVLTEYLNTGDEVAEDSDLSKLVDLSAPGFYTVQVERADRLYSSSHIRSNKITIQVTP